MDHCFKRLADSSKQIPMGAPLSTYIAPILYTFSECSYFNSEVKWWILSTSSDCSIKGLADDESDTVIPENGANTTPATKRTV